MLTSKTIQVAMHGTTTITELKQIILRLTTQTENKDPNNMQNNQIEIDEIATIQKENTTLMSNNSIFYLNCCTKVVY